MNANRRHFSRISFEAPGSLILSQTQHAAVILDISLKGALIRLPEKFDITKGEYCILHLSLGQPDAMIRMKGRVAHLEDCNVGILCHDLDLDSATHLRRLLELNLGDPALLERELAELISIA